MGLIIFFLLLFTKNKAYCHFGIRAYDLGLCKEMSEIAVYIIFKFLHAIQSGKTEAVKELQSLAVRGKNIS